MVVVLVVVLVFVVVDGVGVGGGGDGVRDGFGCASVGCASVGSGGAILTLTRRLQSAVVYCRQPPLGRCGSDSFGFGYVFPPIPQKVCPIPSRPVTSHPIPSYPHHSQVRFYRVRERGRHAPRLQEGGRAQD